MSVCVLESRWLDISNLGLGDDNGQRIAQVMRENTSITHLDVSSNGLGTGFCLVSECFDRHISNQVTMRFGVKLVLARLIRWLRVYLLVASAHALRMHCTDCSVS